MFKAPPDHRAGFAYIQLSHPIITLLSRQTSQDGAQFVQHHRLLIRRGISLVTILPKRQRNIASIRSHDRRLCRQALIVITSLNIRARNEDNRGINPAEHEGEIINTRARCAVACFGEIDIQPRARRKIRCAAGDDLIGDFEREIRVDLLVGFGRCGPGDLRAGFTAESDGGDVQVGRGDGGANSAGEEGLDTCVGADVRSEDGDVRRAAEVGLRESIDAVGDGGRGVGVHV